MQRKYDLIDLFAGCGGMTHGFARTGRFEPVFAVESDADAAATYEMNFGPHVARDAITGAPKGIEDVARFPQAAIVIGGPPCQGFSPLNMRGVGLERRELWQEYVRALRETGCSAFVMENVPELLRSAEYQHLCRAAEALGFTVEGRVLNAADYGVPQTRRRAIVIGLRGASIEWPEPSHTANPDSSPDLAPWRTFRDAVRGLPAKPTGKDWHNSRNPRPLSLRRYQVIPREGEGRFELAARAPEITPDCWLRKKTGSTDVFGRLWWDRPAVTIRTEFFKPEKGRYLHPSEHRPITVREAARCMSFPDSFAFPAPGAQSMTSVARQIGNAVPPDLAYAIASQVARALDRVSAPRHRLPAQAHAA